MSNEPEFAKIVRASDGRQVLYYVSPCGDDFTVHQVTQIGDAQADMAIEFTSPSAEENCRLAFAMLDAMSTETADRLIGVINRLLEGGEA